MKNVFYLLISCGLLQSCYSGINCDPLDPLRFVVNTTLGDSKDSCETQYIIPEVEVDIGYYVRRIVEFDDLVIYQHSGLLSAYDLKSRMLQWTIRADGLIDLSDQLILDDVLFVRCGRSILGIDVVRGEIVEEYEPGVPVHQWDIFEDKIYILSTNDVNFKGIRVVSIDRKTGVKTSLISQSLPTTLGAQDFFVYRTQNNAIHGFVVENHYHIDTVFIRSLDFTSGDITTIEEIKIYRSGFGMAHIQDVSVYSNGERIMAYDRSSGERLWQFREDHYKIDGTGDLVRMIDGTKMRNTKFLDPVTGRAIIKDVTTPGSYDSYTTDENYLITTFLGEMTVYEITPRLREIWTNYLPYSCQGHSAEATSNLLVNREESLITFVADEKLLSIPANFK